MVAAFFIPSTSFATSGACSGHGGVNCSLGPDRDGSVICNDGWTNSKVSYSSMVKCGNFEQRTQPIGEPAPPAIMQNKTVVPPVKNIDKREAGKPKTENQKRVGVPAEPVIPKTQKKVSLWRQNLLRMLNKIPHYHH